MTDDIQQYRGMVRRGPWNSPDLNDVFGQADSIATVPAGVAQDLGFTPSQSREILSHIPNGDFSETPPDTSSNLDDVTNKLPDWSFVTVAGSSITAKAVADSSAGSGYVIRFSGASGNANDEAYIEAVVPIASSRANRIGHIIRAHFLAASTATGTFQVKVQFDYLKSDASTTTGTGTTSTNNFVTSALTTFSSPNASLAAPSDAQYIRCRLGVVRTATNATTATVDLADVYTIVGSDALLVADRTDATKEMAQIVKESDALIISSGVANADSGLVIDGALTTAYFNLTIPYGAKASRTTNQSISDATATSIDFNDTDELDVNGLHSTSSSNELITLDMDGWYMVAGGVVFASNATGNRTAYIELNGKDGAGSVIQPLTRVRAATGDSCGVQATVVKHFSAGDTVALTVKQDSGGALNATDARLAAILLTAG